MKNDSLVTRLDALFTKMVEECEAAVDKPESTITFTDRLRVFDAGVKWVATKNRLEPEDTTDAFGRLRNTHARRGSRGGRPGGADSAGSANGAGH